MGGVTEGPYHRGIGAFVVIFGWFSMRWGSFRMSTADRTLEIGGKMGGHGRAVGIVLWLLCSLKGRK